MTKTFDVHDYTDKDQLLNDLNDHAWQHQDTLLTRQSSKMAHIPSDDGERPAICKNSPEDGRVSDTSTYPPGWRDGMDWCPYCLTREYLGMQLTAAKRHIREDMDRDGTAVISAGSRRRQYHTRECGLWPGQVRAATCEEVASLQQCERCRQIERGDREPVGGGGFRTSVLDREGSCRTPLRLVPAVVDQHRDRDEGGVEP